MNDKRTTIYVTFGVTLLTVCFAFYGCKPHATAVSSAGKIEPCSLLTKEEVATASGDSVNVTRQPDQNACSYDLLTAGSRKDNLRGVIVVAVFPPDSPQYAKFGLPFDDRTEAKPISGVGDKAVLFSSKASPEKGAKAIQVMKGDHRIAVCVSTADPPISIDTLTSLAAKATSRLP